MRISARHISSSSERKSSSNRIRAPITYDTDSSDEDERTSDEEDESYDLQVSVATSNIGDEDEEDEEEDEDEDSLLVPWSKLSLSGRTPDQERSVSETVISVRNHARHVDLYEEWESNARRDAFLTARKNLASVFHDIRERQRKVHTAEQQQYDASRNKELDFLQTSMESHRKNMLAAENRLRERWKQRDKNIRDRIEAAIKEEEDRLRVLQESQRKAREEEERKKREEEEKQKKEEAERKKAEEERKKAEDEKQKKELEETLKKQLEEVERREKEEKAKQEKGQSESLIELREKTGTFDSADMWRIGMRCLKYLKTVTMRGVKGPRPPDPEPAGYQAPPPPPLKKLWNAQRRKITPKIGQLTDDEREILRISTELKAIIAPIPNFPRPDEAQTLHHALLASFSKAVIAQAETEVTAHKAQAGPLARVAISLIIAYPALGDIFWARLCARVGCWAAGTEPLPVDDERWDAFSEKDKQKRWGARSDENLEEQMTRISGVMRLYFAMLFVALKLETKHPMPAPFRPGRFWLYLAQLLNNKAMLERPVTPEIIYVALDEGGVHAKAIWGKQFIKMLQFIYEGISGAEKERFGGSEVLAQASRARCLLEVEKIMAQ